MEGSSKSTAYKQMDVDKGRKSEAENLRAIAFFGVALSTIATLTCVIAVPMF